MEEKGKMPDPSFTRGISVEGVEVPEATFEDYELKHALSIGINEYTAGWPPLENAVRDAQAIGKVLEQIYDFDVRYLYNLDRDSVYRAIEEWSARVGEDRKALFAFVFSGHGDKTGYLVPRDGEFRTNSRWINYPDLCTRLKGLGYRHYLLLLDCCFSGVIAEMKGPVGLPVVSADLVRINFDPAAAVITAGSKDERVYDGQPGGHSPFAAALLDALRYHLPSGHVTLPQSLFSYIQMRLIETRKSIPCYAERDLPGNLGGTGRIIIYRKGFRIITRSLPDGIVGKPYSATLEADGGTPPYHWCGAGLPPGLELSKLGEVAGLPKQVADFTLRVEAKDTDSRTAFRDLKLRIGTLVPPAELEILTDALPPAFVREEYQAKLACRGGLEPYRWTVEPLPEGLKLVADGGPTARIEGSATTAGKREVRISVCDAGDMPEDLPCGVPLVVLRHDEYCEVPAGEFKMGYHRSHARDARINELANKYSDFPDADSIEHSYPSRTVYVRGFLIKKTPVTNREYREFVLATGHNIPAHWTTDEKGSLRLPEGKEDHPVVNVSHADTVGYCKWRGTRLPTAAEWEKAARGTDERLFPWGDDFDVTCCNTAESKVGGTSSVTKHDPECASPYGALDITGNVAEWIDGGKIMVDVYGITMAARCVRGGSWRHGGSLYGMAFVEAPTAFVDEIVYDPTGRAAEFAPQRADWIGFRDAIDLSNEPIPEQKLVNVPGGAVGIPGRPKVACAPFSMARFVVSNLEYLKFVHETGHGRPSHWGRDDPPFPYAQRHWPVVNVSKADAEAFCKWKTQKTGRRHQLPLAIQWELAACGREGRKYPWGNTYQAWRCNSPESGWCRPVSVFELPEGKTPEGVYNLCGNVYEWLSSPGDTRGGSWRAQESCEHVGVGCVNTTNQNELDGDTGFRYVSTVVGGAPNP